DLVPPVDQGHRLAGLQRPGRLPVDGERQRDGPGVLRAVADDDLVVEDLAERRRVHRPGQRTEAAVAEAVERGQVGVTDRYALEAGRPAAEVVDLGGRHQAVHGLGQPPVRGNQVLHRIVLQSRTGQIW